MSEMPENCQYCINVQIVSHGHPICEEWDCINHPLKGGLKRRFKPRPEVEKPEDDYDDIRRQEKYEEDER